MDNNEAKQCESLCFLINMAAKVMGQRLARHFAESDVSVTLEQWHVLVSLWKEDGQCQQDIACGTGKDKASITRLIDIMESDNLVVRVPDKTDRRHNMIHLTNKGKELRGDLFPLAQKTVKEAQAEISPEELAACQSVLLRVIKNLS